LLNERLTAPLLLVAAAIVFGIVTASRGARAAAPTPAAAQSLRARLRAVARFLVPLFVDPEEEGDQPDDRGLDFIHSRTESI
jgi:hypothetical protein